MNVTPTSVAEVLTGTLRDKFEQKLPEFLGKQRWFGGKSRPIALAKLQTVLRLPQSDSALTMVAVHFADGTTDLYQLPVAKASGDRAADISTLAPHAAIATLDVEGTTTIFFDATVEPAFREALLATILSAETIGEDFTAHQSEATDAAALRATQSRVGSAEQSNTSILFGESAILKLFRRLTVGENPDVEIGRFLSTVAHFNGMPAYLGDLTRSADGTTIAYLQAFAPNKGDGWAWMLTQAGSFLGSVAHTATTIASTEAAASSTLEAAALLGQRTAEMHLALATPTDDVAFAAEAYSAESLAAEVARISEQVSHALQTLQQALPNLPTELAAKADELLGARSRILSHLTSLGGDAATYGRRIRIHGDYHLGQVLRTTDDFLIVDFEGEPAKSLEARRRKQSPLKDVAGMLRSFNYVAQSALAAEPKGKTSPSSQQAAGNWENAVADSFLKAYRTTMTVHEDLLPQAARTNDLLLSLLLEKALYELVYELNNRPAWIYLPLDGLLSLVARLPS